MAESDLEALKHLGQREIGFFLCRSKLAEVLERVLKAELIRTGWVLEKTHDLENLSGELRARGSDLMPIIDPLCEEFTEVYFTDRYSGFDLEDPNWAEFRQHLEKIGGLLELLKSRIFDKKEKPS